MNENPDETNNETPPEKNYFRRPFWAVLGAVVIGIIASGLYDLLVKPGINIFSGWFLNIISHWSVSIKNAPFSSAALDPTSLPALIFVLAIPVIFLSILISPITKIIRRKIYEKKGASTKRSKFLSIIPIAYLIILFAIVQTATSIVNKAIFVHRIFNANLNICSQYMTSNDYLIFKSNFSRMETEKDYFDINSQLQKIANENNISLRKEVVKK